MKKKKLTRKSLDELAKIMPILSKEEQRKCIGGAFYYSPDGEYLGQVGPGQGIRMIERSTFYTSTESGCIDESSGFYGLSNTQKMTIINSIASGMGIQSVGSLCTRKYKWSVESK